eukprot:1142144-Pelagomonas_calceolata.AAC.2
MSRSDHSPTQRANPVSKEAQASCTMRCFKDNWEWGRTIQSCYLMQIRALATPSETFPESEPE